MSESWRELAILTLLVDALYDGAYLSTYDQRIRFSTDDKLVVGILRLYDPDRFDKQLAALLEQRDAEQAAKEAADAAD